MGTCSLLSDPFAGLMDSVWQKCAVFWRDAQPGCIHYDDSFGVLTAEYLGDLAFEVRYAGYVVRLFPEKSQFEICAPDGMPRVDADYVRMRIALVFLRMLRGCVHIHAGGICYGTDVVGLLAPSHIGKSTLTGACMAFDPQIGLVSDDVLTILPDHSSHEQAVLPSADYLAMRHEMWDAESFVISRRRTQLKVRLLVSEARRLRAAGRLRALVILDSREGMAQMTSAEAVTGVLQQQLALSEAPESLRRYQFGCIMAVLKSVPVYRMGISMRTRAEALECAGRLVNAVRKS